MVVIVGTRKALAMAVKQLAGAAGKGENLVEMPIFGEERMSRAAEDPPKYGAVHPAARQEKRKS